MHPRASSQAEAVQYGPVGSTGLNRIGRSHSTFRKRVSLPRPAQAGADVARRGQKMTVLPPVFLPVCLLVVLPLYLPGEPRQDFAK